MNTKLTYSFDYCALHYLNQWLEQDHRYNAIFNGGTEKDRLQALKKAATFYQVARTLQTRQKTKDVKKRYGHLLTLIDASDVADLRSSLASGIMEMQARAQDKYRKNRSIRSLLSKMLWLKHRGTSILFDKNARIALGLKDSVSLETFFDLWREKFKEYDQEHVRPACEKLPELYKYAKTPTAIDNESPKRLSRTEVASLSDRKWFRERVFDMYLWHAGADNLQID